jgi:hypothetical protein
VRPPVRQALNHTLARPRARSTRLGRQYRWWSLEQKMSPNRRAWVVGLCCCNGSPLGRAASQSGCKDGKDGQDGEESATTPNSRPQQQHTHMAGELGAQCIGSCYAERVLRAVGVGASHARWAGAAGGSTTEGKEAKLWDHDQYQHGRERCWEPQECTWERVEGGCVDEQ